MSLLDSRPFSGGGQTGDDPGRHRFQGILQHSGTPQLDNPFIVGGLATVMWSEIEPVNGVFDWSPIDQQVAAWQSQGKRAAIQVIVTSTPKVAAMTHSWDALSSDAIPRWLLGFGIPVAVGDAGTVQPIQYWNQMFLSALRRMIHALGTRYDGHNEILFVNAAVGCDGRTSLEDHAPRMPNSFGPSREELWRSIGYSEMRWMESIHAILDYYRGSFEVTPLVAQVTYPFLGGSPEVAVPSANGHSPVSEILRWALSRGMWIEYDCKFTDHAPTEPEWKFGTLIVKPRRSASQQGRPVMADLHRMVNMGAKYAMIHATDLQTARNRAALEWAAAGAVY